MSAQVVEEMVVHGNVIAVDVLGYHRHHRLSSGVEGGMIFPSFEKLSGIFGAGRRLRSIFWLDVIGNWSISSSVDGII